jgi:hypothetical protein
VYEGGSSKARLSQAVVYRAPSPMILECFPKGPLAGCLRCTVCPGRHQIFTIPLVIPYRSGGLEFQIAPFPTLKIIVAAGIKVSQIKLRAAIRNTVGYRRVL